MLCFYVDPNVFENIERGLQQLQELASVNSVFVKVAKFFQTKFNKFLELKTLLIVNNEGELKTTIQQIVQEWKHAFS